MKISHISLLSLALSIGLCNAGLAAPQEDGYDKNQYD